MNNEQKYVVRITNFTINGDLSCIGWKEDFELDSPEFIRESLIDYLRDNIEEYLTDKNLFINEIYYEEE